MKEFFVGNNIIEISVIDENGDFVSSLSITYEIRNSSTDVLFASGTLSEGTNSYYKSINFSVAGQYRVLYTTPINYEDASETVIVRVAQASQDSVDAIKAQTDGIANMALETTVQDIKDKTNNLPADPASETGALAKEDTVQDIKTETDKITTLINFESGKWKIISNQLIFYKVDNSELTRFNLYDADGNPTMTDVVERRPV